MSKYNQHDHHQWKSAAHTIQAHDKNILHEIKNKYIWCLFLPCLCQMWHIQGNNYTIIQKWMTTSLLVESNLNSVIRCIFQNTDTLKYPIGWMVIFSSLVCKKWILKDWKGSEAPSLQLWKGLMKYYLSIERSMFEDRNRRRQFNKVWQDLYEAL